MLKRSVFKAESNRGLNFQRFLNGLSLKVFADEGSEESTNTDTPNPQGQLNFEQMVAQARKEEKDKLYPRIKKLEEENKTLTSSINTYLLNIAALKDELEKLRADKGDDSVIKDLESKIDTLTKENNTLRESAPKEEDIRKKVEAEYEVKLYAQEQVANNKDSIISTLIPEITGKTKEEVDAAIASAKEKTLTVKKELGLVDDEGNEVTKPEDKKEKPKKAPPAVPATESQDSYDAEYVRNLDPRSPEYREFRKKMGLK